VVDDSSKKKSSTNKTVREKFAFFHDEKIPKVNKMENGKFKSRAYGNGRAK